MDDPANPLPLLSADQVLRLVSHPQGAITGLHPWCDDEVVVDAFLRRACDDVAARAGVAARIEWDHYGSGYASFVDAWFYRPTPAFRLPGAHRGEAYVGLAVLLSRLSPYFVFLQGTKHWHEKGGSSDMPSLAGIDAIDSRPVADLARTIEPILESHGLVRVRRGQLSSALPAGTAVPTVLGDPPYTQFDALFHWED